MSELVWIYTLGGAQKVALRDISDLTIEDRLDDVSSLKFTIRAEDPRTDYLVPDAQIRWKTRRFRIVELDQTRGNDGAKVGVYAEALWTDLGRKIRFANFPVLGLKPQAGLVKILAGTGWSAGVDPNPSGTVLYSTEGYDDSVLAHLRRWASVTGYELSFDTAAKKVALVAQVGADRGVGFRYGSNVTKIRRRYEPPRATVLYPVGANSLTVESVNPSGEAFVEDFSWYVAQGLTVSQARSLHTKEEVWVDSNFLTPLPLYDRGVERLATRSQPIISYEASVVDLSDAVGTDVPFEIGDLVKVREETFGVDISTRIVRRVYRPNSPGGDEIELSYLRPTGFEVDQTETRTPDYGQVSVLVDACGDLTIAGSAEDWAVIQYNSTGSASTVVVGSTFVGVATGSGTIRHSFIVDTVGEGPVVEQTFGDGELVEFSFPSYVADLAEGSHTLAWRAQIIAGAGTVALDAGDARGWALATGAFGLGVNTSPNRRVVEELLDVLVDGISDEFLVEIQAAIDIEVADTLEDAVLDAPVDKFILPFTIESPVFGLLDGPGALS